MERRESLQSATVSLRRVRAPFVVVAALKCG
jgi:hypothetical protein